MAGLQAQTSTANVAPQKADAFTPSGRIQRQGFKNAEQVGLVIAAIDKQLEILNPEIFSNNLSFTDSERQVAQLLAKLYPWYQGGLLITKFALEKSPPYPRLLDLQGLDLQGADLQGLALQGAQLLWTKLRQAKLRQANLPEANMTSAILSEADLTGAQLPRADLSKTDLRWADMTGAGLQGTNLDDAILNGAKMEGVDLKGAFGVPLGITPEMLATARNTEVLEKCINLSERIKRSRSSRKEALELELQRFIDQQEQLRQPPKNWDDPLIRV
jgi:uncharacterized protein YjbI with pentapeptide repeats